MSTTPVRPRSPRTWHLRWTIPLIVLIALVCLFKHYVVPRQVGDDDLQGLTKQQILDRYGEPTDRADPDFWIYYRGMAGGGTGIVFKEGVVVHYESRGAQ